MNVNLDKIAKELYGKIQTRFDDIQFGDEEGTVLSKKADIPKARFFEFEYKEDGEILGNIAITLDEEDGIIIQIADDLVDDDNSIHRDVGICPGIRSIQFWPVNLRSRLAVRAYRGNASKIKMAGLLVAKCFFPPPRPAAKTEGF